MRNPARQLHRSRLPVHAVPRRLGEVDVPSTSCEEVGDEGEEARDAETYDDADFYTQLLKVCQPGNRRRQSSVAPSPGRHR